MDKRSAAKGAICALVEQAQGCKALELIAKLGSEQVWVIEEVNSWTAIELIEELVEEGELIEIEYTLPNMSYRVKSFLLPKGTEIDPLAP